MSKIIKLGVEVAGVNRRFTRVHGLVFGRGSYRLILDAVTGKRGSTYRRAVRTLNTVERKIDTLEEELGRVELADCPPRAGLHLRDALLEYCRVLREAVSQLRHLCTNLAYNEPDYRNTSGGELSRFNQDKMKYDDRKSELERLGTRLNKLFAGY